MGMKLEGYPNVTDFYDRHGTQRWRFRSRGRTVALPDPNSPEFQEAYNAAVEGRAPRQAVIVPMPGAVVPQSFGDAWKRVLKTEAWHKHDPATKLKNTRLAEEFLLLKVDDDQPELWRDMLVSEMRRKHLKGIIARFMETPTKGKHMVTAIRKMIEVAMDEEWRDDDPSYKLNFRPEPIGWKAWTRASMDAFEKRWPVGTTPRLVYAVALWLGNRRSDVARLRKSDRCVKVIIIDGERREFDGFQIVQKKGGFKKSIFMPITPMLAGCLDAINHDQDTLILNGYGDPYSEKSLTGMMAHWTNLAGMEKGFTMHGLRKSLGVYLAEADATTRQIMEALGHDDIQHAELYSREASQVRLAVQGMEKVTRLMRGG